MEVTQTDAAKSDSRSEARAADLQNWAGNWIWRAVQCLVESPDFNASPKWIAGRLNVSIEKAVDAVEGLERLGFILRNGASYKHVNDWVQLLPGEISSSELLSRHSKIAPQIIAKLNSSDKFTSQFFLGNQELVSRYAGRFIRLYQEMNEEGLRLGLKEVIASEISFVQLTDSANTGDVV